MLGLVITLIAAAAPALPATATTCGGGPDSCELPTAPGQAEASARGTSPERTYATPAVIDCRSMVVPAVLSTLVGECIGMPHDASYRASRYPESEDSQSLTPASRERRGGAVCDGLPQDAPRLTVTHLQPIALYATPIFVPAPKAARVPTAFFEPRSRLRDPPDRPPRV